MSVDSHSQTFLDYAAQAEAGDAEAQYQIGHCYAQGKGVERSYRSAAHFWLKAAKQQHSEAQMYLGTLFEKGLEVPQDFVKAAQCYHTAAQQGSATAKVRLAMLYFQGLGVTQDTNQAINLFIQAAEQGDAAAQYNLGAAYEKGLGRLTQNRQQAIFWYEQAAQQHYPQAVKALDTLNAESEADASSLIDGSTSETLPDTDDNAATATPSTPDADVVFAQGVSAIKHSVSEALDRFEQAVARLPGHEHGHARAQYNVALAHLFGLGGREVSQQRAQDLLQQAAAQGFRPAYFVLGWLAQGGLASQQNLTQPSPIQTDSDIATAIGYFEKAGELGHAQAQYFLAKIYGQGNGVEMDEEKSLLWLRQAAKQGHGSAYQELERLIP